MAFHVKHPRADTLVRELAALRGTGLTEAIVFALEKAVAAENARTALPEVADSFRRELALLRKGSR